MVGTANGVVRALDLTNPRKPILVGHMRLYKHGKNRPISKILFRGDCLQLAISSVHSKKVFYLSCAPAPDEFFMMMGFHEMPAKVNDIAWNRADKGPDFHLHVLTYFTDMLIKTPSKSLEDKRVKQEMTVRKIDPYMKHIVSLDNGEFIVTGDDKLLRRYKNPE